MARLKLLHQMNNRSALCVGVLAITGLYPAQKYVGADAALKVVNAPLPTKARGPEIADPFAAFLKRVDRFRRDTSKLSPAEAAKGWLALVDGCPATDIGWPSAVGSSPNPAFADVMSALPSPPAWAEMEKLLRVRLTKRKPGPKDRALLSMVEWLRGERDQATRELSSIKGLPAVLSALTAKIQLDGALFEQQPDSIESTVRKLIAALSAVPRRSDAEQEIELPDLDRLIGSARARKLLAYSFQTFDGKIVLKQADPFVNTARHLALEMAGKLKHPQWALVADAEAGPLFEAMHRRFPAAVSENSNWPGTLGGYGAASIQYLIYLVANNRVDAAAAYVKREAPNGQFLLPFFRLQSPMLQMPGKMDAFLQFLEREASSGDDTGVINYYNSLCQSIGQTKRADAFVATLPISKRGYFGYVDKPFDGLITMGKLEEAGRLLISRITDSTTRNGDTHLSSELIDIGRKLNRPDWVELGIATAVRSYRNNTVGFSESWICLDLADHGRAAEAEGIVADVLQRKTHDGSSSSSPIGQEELITLMRVYAAVGRWQDLLTILHEAPNLGQNDLAFLDNSGWGMDSLPYLTAKALAAVGRRDEAVHILRYVLESEPDNDEVYALLLELDPIGAGTLLDAMRRAAPMAPRPKMWKAEWLRRNRQLAAAEQTVRDAIALDPDDTLTNGVGGRTRFRAWQILSDIEHDEGKMAKAAADRHTAAVLSQIANPVDLDLDGPAKRAKALAKNPGDFTGRLAVADDLEHIGKHEEAMAMRTQAARQAAIAFGPASSTDWPGYRASILTLLERVLSEEAAKHPKRASTFAALGAVYDDLEQSIKAKQAYSRAVALDPDFLAAWKGLMGLQAGLSLPREIEDRLVSNLLRLAPGDLTQGSWEARDLAAVWSVADLALKGLPPVSEPIFQLSASSLSNSSDTVNNEQTRIRTRPPTAGSIIAADRTIADFTMLIGWIKPYPKGTEK